VEVCTIPLRLMPAAYSDDLREKVLTAVNRGEKKATLVRCLPSAKTPLIAGLNSVMLLAVPRQCSGSTGGETSRATLETFQAFATAHGHLIEQQTA
jgi:hypothetical protein